MLQGGPFAVMSQRVLATNGKITAAVQELRAASPHAPLSLAAAAELASALVRAAGRNVCQASIAIDAALSSLAGAAFMIASARAGERAHPLHCELGLAPAGADARAHMVLVCL